MEASIEREQWLSPRRGKENGSKYFTEKDFFICFSCLSWPGKNGYLKSLSGLKRLVQGKKLIEQKINLIEMIINLSLIFAFYIIFINDSKAIEVCQGWSVFVCSSAMAWDGSLSVMMIMLVVFLGWAVSSMLGLNYSKAALAWPVYIYISQLTI